MCYWHIALKCYVFRLELCSVRIYNVLTGHAERKVRMMLSKNLKIIRESRGIGVNELARRSGVNASYISAIENGRRENPSKEILSKIADALEIPVEELLVEKMRTNEDEIEDDVELRVMFNKIRNLSDGDKRKIKAVLDAFDQEVE